jgi:hypothetical protein
MKKQAGFHLLPIILIIVAVGVAGLIAWRVLVKPAENSAYVSGNQNNNFAQQYGQDCTERDVSFTSPPMRMQDLGYIRPLGAMLDGHVTPTDHVYVGPVNQQAADNTYPVLMPANGTIIDISRMPDQYIGDRQGVALAPEDHRIVISFSCRYYAIYIHVHKLADALASQVSGIKANESKKVKIDLKAGDTVGYIGGQTFDWTPIDTKTTLSGFITPSLYNGESWKVYTVSPFDLYTGDLKKQLEAKSLRTAAPIGGKIDYDQAGKLIGTWFRAGTNGYSGKQQDRYWDGHLSVVPDYISPNYTIVSIGNWQGSAKQFAVKNSPNPANTGSGQVVKYELVELSYVSQSGANLNGQLDKDMHPDLRGGVVGTIMFEVQPGEKLKVEKFAGKTADQIAGFTAAAETYER